MKKLSSGKSVPGADQVGHFCYMLSYSMIRIIVSSSIILKKKKLNLCLVCTAVYDAAVTIWGTFLNISVKVSLEETPPRGVLAPSSFSHIAQFLFEEV